MSLQLKNVSFQYPGMGSGIDALQETNLTIQDGEFVGIMGRTGCGKTTLIQLIAGLQRPTQGQILLDGQDIWGKKYDRSILRKKVGIVFQYPEYQLFETTVERDVAFGLKYHGLTSQQVEQRVREALELMNFDYEEIRGQSPLALSGGEKRRVAIAGILACKPQLLIFDEPVAGLDPYAREDFLNLVRKLNQQGTTVLMVSHNADAISQVAKRLLLLHDGVVALDGDVAYVLHHPKRREFLPCGEATCQRIAEELRHRGMSLSENVVSYGDLLEELKKAGGEHHG